MTDMTLRLTKRELVEVKASIEDDIKRLEQYLVVEADENIRAEYVRALDMAKSIKAKVDFTLNASSNSNDDEKGSGA